MIDVFGVELTEGQVEAYRKWLDMEEGRTIHNKVLKSLEETANRNIRRNPVHGQDWHLFTAQREQFIGQSDAWGRAQGIREALDSVL